jgi:signal transduction histidine kinase
MMRKSLSSRLKSRTAFVGVLLLGALALTGLLAWQAFDAGRSHAEAVKKTLGEQVRFAAWEYAGNARDYLDSKILYPGLEVTAIAGGKTAGAALTMEKLRKVAGEKDWPYVQGVTGVFRVELTSGVTTFSGASAPPRGSAAVATASSSGPTESDEATRRWIADELRTRILHDSTPAWEPVMVAEPEHGGTFVYRLYPEERSEAEVAYGFRVAPGGLDAPLGYAFTLSPLIPESLTGGRGNAEVFAVTVADGAGRPVWRSPEDYTSDVAAMDTVGTRYAGLTARVVVNPDVAPDLVIGGFPRSRLPVIVVLLLLTAGLVAGAFFQLRQETELAQLRADFVSGVSHELRTPLAQIRMFSETLLLGRVRNDEERRRSLEIIVNEARRLTHQVDNVLLYSRSERDGMRLEAEETELGRLVDEVAEAFRPLAVAAGCKLEIAAATGCIARVDGALLRQALLNLLDNALKYGPSGQTVRLGLGVERAWIRLWVDDEGSGVPEEDRGRIWEPYFRMASHRESAVAGSGIGLSVVREVAEAHGGRARVETGERGGARFVIEIPAEVLSMVGPAGRERQRRAVQANGGTGPVPSPATLREATD